jgi:hypothetical protein
MSDDFEDIQPGDYVVATKFSDGDPSDHWCVGFYSRTIRKGEALERHVVLDGAGKPFRLNGFTRMERISDKAAEWILQVGPPLEGRPSIEPSIWTLLHCRETILEARAQGAAEERERLAKLAEDIRVIGILRYDSATEAALATYYKLLKALRSNTGEE